ncbi:hypothetical protein ACRYCC_38100 [Actinomadura scrupuli]|uniref:hypothetical protein n=1 Tax=Actinomadura scrupuli TaxID=559629 RepID=UPI003D982B6F
MFTGTDDHGDRPWIRSAAYADHPGPVLITITAVDAAGNESTASNGQTVTTQPC